MSPSRKRLCAAAVILAVVIPAGCANTSQHTAHPRSRIAPDPASLALLERQMLNEMQTGGVQLGAADGLGRALHNQHMIIAVARRLEGSGYHAGADVSTGSD